jgi:ABC-type transport system involved in multi-copper enzyme maturation permease subunit
VKGSFAAEILKLRKRAAVWVLLATWLGLNTLFGYILPYTSYLTGVDNVETQGTNTQELLAGVLPEQIAGTALGGYPVFTGAIVLIFGALATGSEYSWGTLKTALTQRPTRIGLLAGKLLALLVMVLGGILIHFALSAAISSTIAVIESESLSFGNPVDILVGLGTGWLILGMWCLFGALFGIIFQGIALPIGLGVVWVLGVENLVSGVADSLLTGLRPLRNLLPGANSGSLIWAVDPNVEAGTGPPPGVINAVTGNRALVTLICYVIVFAAVAAVTLRRRDVV